MSRTDQPSTPEEVLASRELDRDAKIALLREWAYDQEEIASSQSEGMDGPPADLHRRVLLALRTLERGPSER
ncbi:MAG: hypothetical protein R3F34_09740 [Planctomycetota bacterium]